VIIIVVFLSSFTIITPTSRYRTLSKLNKKINQEVTISRQNDYVSIVTFSNEPYEIFYFDLQQESEISNEYKNFAKFFTLLVALMDYK